MLYQQGYCIDSWTQMEAEPSLPNTTYKPTFKYSAELWTLITGKN